MYIAALFVIVKNRRQPNLSSLSLLHTYTHTSNYFLKHYKLQYSWHFTPKPIFKNRVLKQIYKNVNMFDFADGNI